MALSFTDSDSQRRWNRLNHREKGSPLLKIAEGVRSTTTATVQSLDTITDKCSRSICGLQNPEIGARLSGNQIEEISRKFRHDIERDVREF